MVHGVARVVTAIAAGAQGGRAKEGDVIDAEVVDEEKK